MKKTRIICLLICCLFVSASPAQSVYIPLDRDYYHLLDRYILLEKETNTFKTAFKPYRRDQTALFLDSIMQKATVWNKVDRFNLAYLRDDNWEFSEKLTASSNRPWKGLYRKPADFFHYRDSLFDLHINPVLYLGGGVDEGKIFYFRNTRGIEIHGSVDRKVGFYTFVTATNIKLPPWVDVYARHHGAVPGEGFWKRYGAGDYSYFSARGHLSFQLTRHINAQIGQDRNFYGEGYRSMILSDFSNPYLFAKLNTTIWRFSLTHLWAQMNADIYYDRGRPTDGRYPQKWFSHHRLGMDLSRNLNVGIFESVMSNQFDWNYANPVIFYRWVEHQLGSPDKVMLGLDFKWNFYPAMQLYGQFALNEFVFREFFEIDGKNSSRNKHGLQIGYKNINLFKIPNLDLQLEYNQARPYTYQEKFQHQSFTNYRIPLAHPRGANFKEAIGIFRYQPLSRLTLKATGIFHYYGSDPSADSNYGGDILKNRTTQNTSLFGNYIGQGVLNTVMLANLTTSYHLKHGLFIDFNHTFRRHSVAGSSPRNIHYSQLSLRLNSPRQDVNY